MLEHDGIPLGAVVTLVGDRPESTIPLLIVSPAQRLRVSSKTRADQTNATQANIPSVYGQKVHVLAGPNKGSYGIVALSSIRPRPDLDAEDYL